MKELLSENILPNVLKPARYTGGELNSIKKDWDKTEVKVCLSYPDTYEVGMSNLGLQILYHIINNLDFALAERSYAPWPDMEAKLRENKLPLYSLESFRPLNKFDLIGFSLQHELTYTNLINMLDLANIPIYSKDRSTNNLQLTTDNYPLIFAGGPCAFNPLPLAPFIDFFYVGEGEEAIVEIVNSYRANRSRAREELLKELSKIEGVYVPSLGEAKKIKRRSIRNLDTAPTPTKPIVPFIETIHDHAMLELMRGCPRTCKFCHACATYRPVRTRVPETLIRLAEELIRNTGYDELSLISLSTADYPKFGELAKVLAGKFESKKISITLPSVRMDSFSIDIARELGRVKPASVTLAPEAGTERLREFIGKNLTEEEILGGARSAFEAEIEKIKLYFMIGLPTERQEDLQGIVDLAQKIANLGRSVFQEMGRNKKRIRITISVATFIPKPHTQFEREGQISIQETLNKQSFLKSNLRDKAIELRWHDASASFLEGVFSRGDGSLSKVIEAAWKLGSRLDAWSEHFKLETWDRSFTESGIDPNSYLRKREESEQLPWDFIEV